MVVRFFISWSSASCNQNTDDENKCYVSNNSQCVLALCAYNTVPYKNMCVIYTCLAWACFLHMYAVTTAARPNNTLHVKQQSHKDFVCVRLRQFIGKREIPAVWCVCIYNYTKHYSMDSAIYFTFRKIAQFDQKCWWFARLQIGGNQELFVFIIPQQPHPGSSGLSRMVRFQ